jgi:NAD(P)H-hydrate epimerase
MRRLFTPGGVQEMDTRAFSRGATSSGLMETAAGHLARAVRAVAGGGYGLRVAVLCGKGNNGGDGIAAARRLLDAGAAPTVCLLSDEAALSDDAAAQLARYRALGGRVGGDVADALVGADVGVDCLLGTGSLGAPRQPYADAVEALNAADAPVVACDTPTGVDADTGEVPGAAVRAERTVALAAHKRGHWLWPGRGCCGDIVLGELGIADADDEPVARVLEPAEAASWAQPPAADSDKRSRGVVTVVAGSPGMSGAAVMTARGAMAAGAGLVTVATPTPARYPVAASLPEAVTVALADDADAAFDQVATQAEDADCVALGPGLGLADSTVTLIRRLVAELEVPVVVDADGLNAFRHDGDALAEHAPPLLVLTPHARELARLVERPVADIWPRRAELLPERARAWGAVVVAKGAGSLVATPDGRSWINPTGTGALATAGTGDVLTGITGALVAQHPAPDAVAAAAYLHGLAGQAAADASHPRSVTALDVAAATPTALGWLDRARPGTSVS